MKRALFRADGSHRLGMGHIMRCLALAQRLKQMDVMSLFVIRDYEPCVAELIRSWECTVETIPQHSSLAEDASLTMELASHYRARMIITDLSNSKNMANMNEYRRYFRGMNIVIIVLHSF